MIAKCNENWIAGPIVTVDEQLLALRGRVAFRMYISNNPTKYGIKIFMAADSEFHYFLNSIPYLGKGSIPQMATGENLGQYFTLKLLDNLMKPSRTICLDNWFTFKYRT